MHHHSNSFFPCKPQYLLWAMGTVSLPNSQSSLDVTDNDSCHDVCRWERYPLTSFCFLSQKEPERIIETSSGAPEGSRTGFRQSQPWQMSQASWKYCLFGHRGWCEPESRGTSARFILRPCPEHTLRKWRWVECLVTVWVAKHRQP